MANIRNADLFWIMDMNVSWILHLLSGNQQIKERQKENRVRRRNNSMSSNNVSNVELLICVSTQQFFFQKSKGALRKVNYIETLFKFLFFHEYLLSNLFCRISVTLPIVANWVFRQGPYLGKGWKRAQKWRDAIYIFGGRLDKHLVIDWLSRAKEEKSSKMTPRFLA